MQTMDPPTHAACNVTVTTVNSRTSEFKSGADQPSYVADSHSQLIITRKVDKMTRRHQEDVRSITKLILIISLVIKQNVK